MHCRVPMIPTAWTGVFLSFLWYTRFYDQECACVPNNNTFMEIMTLEINCFSVERLRVSD